MCSMCVRVSIGHDVGGKQRLACVCACERECERVNVSV